MEDLKYIGKLLKKFKNCIGQKRAEERFFVLIVNLLLKITRKALFKINSLLLKNERSENVHFHKDFGKQQHYLLRDWYYTKFCGFQKKLGGWGFGKNHWNVVMNNKCG